ncbi:MAG: MBOAT family protein [Planctomycetales bacterium]|nr:MBOAT family protein [bacterium]UNM08697.1 MAG: MBOAT family protein [Planctomycetales bacterium]
MLFPSLQFAGFMLLLLAILALLRGQPARKLLLLVASYLFYMAWNPAFIILIIFSSFVDWFVGAALEHEERRQRRMGLLLASLVANLGLLAWFKYSGFLSAMLLGFSRELGLGWHWQWPEITLPVGISFYTFQTLSYSIDIYARRIRPARSLLDYALYVAFFPQLVAGPIVRASEFLPQLTQGIRLRLTPKAVSLISGGLVKKVVIADNLAPYVDAVYGNPASFSGPDILLATLCFSTQIYCDFSGYSDMAIGLASIFGLELPRNFNYPYFAQGASDYWRRWHITLSRWLRDYLYIPLGGNRHGTTRTYINLMLTMLLGGLWHGAGWTFILWGAWHGLLLVLQRLNPLERALSRPAWRLPVKLSSWLLFQACVLFGWMLFRAADWYSLGELLGGLQRFGHGWQLQRLDNVELFTVICVLLIFWCSHMLMYQRQRRIRREPSWRSAMATLAASTLLLALLWPADSAPFIYFQF